MAQRKPRIGIALGAGSSRGWAHIGVLQTLVAAGIVPEVVAGTSIGALVGAVYADDDLAGLDRWVRALTLRKVWGYFDLTLSGGLLKGDRLFGDLRGEFLSKRIEDLRRPFSAVATDLVGKIVGVEVGLLHQRFPCALEESLLGVLQHLLEALKILLIQDLAPGRDCVVIRKD